jgi:hypothetical protein
MASSCSCRLLKWENVFWSFPWQSRDRRLRLFDNLQGVYLCRQKLYYQLVYKTMATLVPP